MKNLKNWDNKTWLSSKSYISQFNKFLKRKSNLNKTYNVDVSNYIKDTLLLNKDERINYINMSKIDFSNFNKNKIYKPDLASHLEDVYHSEIFIKNILTTISKQN